MAPYGAYAGELVNNQNIKTGLQKLPSNHLSCESTCMGQHLWSNLVA